MNVSANVIDSPPGRRVLPSFFLAGYQKTATTWLYHCFKEHPDVFVPGKHSINYFDIHYQRGESWYQSFFADAERQSQVGDVTPTYMRFHASRTRMAELNPDAKVLVTLRNPIDRAFSHYWHEKKKRKIGYRFEECLSNNADIFDDWLASGFYHSHLTHLLTLIPREQMLILFYDDLIESPSDFLRQTLTFLDVEPQFKPAVLQQAVNKAWFRPTYREMFANFRSGRPLKESEYDRGVDPNFRKKLQELFAEQNCMLGELVGRDLSHWK